MGGKSSTSTVHNEPPPEVMAAYKDLLAKANPVAATPYKPYTGGVNGSGFEQNQLTGFQNVANQAGASNGDFGAASTALSSAATPTYASVGQYMSPYISGVINSTMANMQEQNAQQQQGVLGNAIAQGAMGGNRVGVAQSELARQQGLANQATLANLWNTGYGQAMSAAQAQQAADQATAAGYTNLGQTAMQTNLAQAVSQIGAGTQQQQYNYQQYQNQQSYPFQTLGWLANIVEGAGAGMGGTQTTTQPAGNTGSGILGGLLGLGALFLNRGGAVHDRVKRAQGGVIPYGGSSGIVPMNDNGRPADNDNGSYVPQAATGTTGKSTMPTGGVPQPAQQDPMLQQGMKSMEGALQKKYPNGILAGLDTVKLPDTAPIPTPNPMAGVAPSVAAPAASAAAAAAAPEGPGLLSGLASLLGFADGGAVRRGYDVGGAVGEDPLLDNIRAFLAGSSAPQSPQPLSDQAFNDRVGSATSSAGVVAPPAPLADFGDHGPVPQPLSEDQRAAIRARDEANLATFGDNPPSNSSGVVADRPLPAEYASRGITQDQWNAMNAPDAPSAGVAPAPASGVAPPLPSRTIQDRPEAPSVPEYQPERVSKYSGAFNQINDQYGLPAGYLNQTAYIESGFNPNADNGIARGAFQFTGPTAKQYGLANPFDPIASAQAAAKLASDNSKFLAGGLGRQPSAGELYLAHQQGAAGALNLLTHPDALATDIVGRQAVIQNGGSPDMTAAQFADLWTSRFNSVSPNSSSDATVLRMADNGPVQGNQSNGILVGPQPMDDARGVLSSILHGERPRISDDMRMALLSAGLGMMASKSPNMLTGIGEGGMQGIKTYMEKQQLNRENAQAQSEIATRAGNLGLEGRRVDIAGQDLALKAKSVASEIAQQTAETAKTGVETAAQRFQQTITPAGIIVRDVTQPMSPPRLLTWDQLQSGQSIPGVTDQTAPAASPPSAAAPAATAPTKEPVAQAAPVQPVGPQPAAPQQQPQGGSGQVFTRAAPQRPPIDPRLFSPIGADIVKGETTDALKDARAGYQASVSAETQLAEMKHDLATINNSAWTTPGTGFAARVNFAKAVNTAMQGMGMEAPIDEKAVAAGEDLNKLTTRLGFDLSSALGSREAANIVNQAIGAVPGGANSPEGARRIIAGIQAANQRKTDYYNFLQDWASKTGGSIKGADEYFNTHQPPELYALTTIVPPEAMQHLRQHPETAKQFDQFYGVPGASNIVLGSQ